MCLFMLFTSSYAHDIHGFCISFHIKICHFTSFNIMLIFSLSYMRNPQVSDFDNLGEKRVRTSNDSIGCMASVKKELHRQYCTQLRTNAANFQTIMVKHSRKVKTLFRLVCFSSYFLWTDMTLLLNSGIF